jgi:pimeloyl-ACP methyl ester carboxylesterase
MDGEDTSMPSETRTLETPDVDLVYEVRRAATADAGRPTLLMAGHPMDARGFDSLAPHFTDRTVVTYDPRGIGRSVRKDGSEQRTPELHAADLHALVTALGSGPVDLFASSGGAVNALALVAAYPDDVATLVAHEPPLLAYLPDADHAFAAEHAVQTAYHEHGFGAGMAAFIALTSWTGEFTDGYLARPAPDPAQFGLPTHDDGRRDDPLLSGTANAITSYRPDLEALKSSTTRVVIGVGVESREVLTGRVAPVLARALRRPLTEFPSHHGGFLGGEHGYAGQPEAFAARLHAVLDDGAE